MGPSFLKEPPSRVDFANETGARIDCSAGGSPPPNISWLSGDGKPVGPIPRTRELLANGSLLFPAFLPSGYRHDVHAATYRCVAENSVGRIHSRDVRVRAGNYQQTHYCSLYSWFYFVIQNVWQLTLHHGSARVAHCVTARDVISPTSAAHYVSMTSDLRVLSTEKHCPLRPQHTVYINKSLAVQGEVHSSPLSK